MSNAALWEAYERTRTRSLDPMTRDATHAEWDELVASFRTRAADATDLDAARGLGLALWRKAHTRLLAGDAAAALEPGTEALQVLVARLRRLREAPATDPSALDQAEADVLTAWADHGEAIGPVHGPTRQVEHLQGAVGKDPNELGPLSRRALGSVHHNLSCAQLNAAVETIRAGRTDVDPTAAAMSASRAFEIRMRIATPEDPMTLWEWFNTHVHYARCLLLIGDKPRARAVVDSAEKGMSLAPSGAFADLQAQLAPLAQAARA